MEVKKPVVQIKECYIEKVLGDNTVLSGIPIDYPDSHMVYEGCVTNGRRVYTSSIVAQDGNFVETKRTVYHVLNWIENEN